MIPQKMLKNRCIVSITLLAFVMTFFPSVGMAQPPSATITALSGTVLVNSAPVSAGSVLEAGAVIETQQGASLVVEFSDGSQLEIGEDSQLNLAQFSQTGDSARVSKLKLAWGWMRARLSPRHQQEGSKFDIETPNA
jgi:hypothetical protein